jgi:hypothetical protein
MGELNYSVFPFSPKLLAGKDYLDNSDQANYIIRYLEEVHATTCVLETNYIDKDYMIDYQLFYCRSFKDVDKTTKRIHFFSKDFSQYQFEENLVHNLKYAMQSLNESYLGFVVVKPIKDDEGQYIIGRTLLKPYPLEGSRSFVTGDYSASLLGMNLKIQSLPFQIQDLGVGVCATVSLWSALHPLKDLFEIVRHSPAEITEISSSSPGKDRKFPQTGLNLEQMINYIGRLGLDVETLDPANFSYFSTFLKMYIHAGLPVIAALTMEKNRIIKRHAVVISGYRADDNFGIEKIFVHDDRIGPYCKVKPEGSFLSWKYERDEWNDWGYKVKLDKLIVPVYPKIRTPFMFMNVKYRNVCNDVAAKIGPLPEYHCELYLKTVRDYKNFCNYSATQSNLYFPSDTS